MKKNLILKGYNYLHYILILLIFLCIAKLASDFYNKNKNLAQNSNNIIEYQNIILEPKLQFNNNGFQFIEAWQGVEDNQNYIFTNVKTHGDFGKGSAGKLEITENKNILKFSENPEFTIYTKRLKE